MFRKRLQLPSVNRTDDASSGAGTVQKIYLSAKARSRTSSGASDLCFGSELSMLDELRIKIMELSTLP